MKKLLYMSAINENSKYVGVWKKIRMQMDYFQSQNIEVEFYDVNKKDNNTIASIVRRRLPYTGVYDWAVDRDKIKNVDCVYIRKESVDYQLIKSLKRMKKYNSKIKILMEIPTYPYDNEEKLTYSNAMLILKDRWNKRKLYKYVDYILTYSKNEMIFKIPTMRLSNAVDTSIVSAKKATLSDRSINIIAVASFAFWHGYDRFLEGMHEYYKSDKENKLNIMLHLVGDGDELVRYKSLVEDYNLHHYVCFYGRKDGKELDEVYDKCEIGLDAMGRHRANIYYNSTLKGKEYGAKGLPIISGVETEIDSDTEYRYYMRVPANESPVDMESVINFYNQIYNIGESKEKIISKIREYNRNKFDISIVWKKVADYIKADA